MQTSSDTTPFDVIVIGGSYAGQAAAMQLGRARRRVLVIDAGERRNRFTAITHSVPGRDGVAPEVIAAEGRAQVEAYPGVRWQEDRVTRAERDADGFTVHTLGGQRWHARLLVLAIGVIDELPEVEGLAERWGKTVFHCPYCHGYELEQGRIGLLANGPVSMHFATMLPDWGQLTLLLDGSFEPDAEQRALLTRRGVTVEHARVTRIVGQADVELADGRRIALDGLFTVNRLRLASPVAEQLGCELEQGPLGPYVRTDDYKQTSVPGVFACGDISRLGGSIPLVVGDGALTGMAAHRQLVYGG